MQSVVQSLSCSPSSTVTLTSVDIVNAVLSTFFSHSALRQKLTWAFLCADVIGIVGSIGFIPMSFIFPPLFVLVAKRHRGPVEYWLCVTIMVVMGTGGVLAFVGSLRNLIVRAQAYHY